MNDNFVSVLVRIVTTPGVGAILGFLFATAVMWGAILGLMGYQGRRRYWVWAASLFAYLVFQEFVRLHVLRVNDHSYTFVSLTEAILPSTLWLLGMWLGMWYVGNQEDKALREINEFISKAND